MKGKVIIFNENRGYGKILGDDGKYYFALSRNILGRPIRILYPNEFVDFDIELINDPNKNDIALNVMPKEVTYKSPSDIMLNPFNLKPINKPENFAGRKQLIRDGVTALVDNNNILLTGNRGIGKSSLANQLFFIAQGNKFLLDKLNIRLQGIRNLNFGVVSIRAYKESNISDIAGSIIREFIKKYNLDKKTEFQHEINLKIYKLKTKTITSDEAAENLLELFNFDIIKIHDKLGYENGLLIFIDEVENIDPDSGFALFVKNITEYFTTESRKINFILSGIPSAITDYFAQHPSFLRLFIPLEVKELATIESYEVIDGCMKNNIKAIDKNTRANICQISKGYPVNLQLLGYYSYSLDTDGFIDSNDMHYAIRHIISNVKKPEFSRKHESIGYGLAEDILKYTTLELNGNSTYNSLIYKFKKINEIELMSAVDILIKKEIFSSIRKGEYFINDFLFYKYLRQYYRE